MKKYILICMLVTGCIAIKPSNRIEFDAQECYPEGIAYNKAKDVYYVSSMRKGTIGEVTPAGNYAAFYTDNTLKSTYGMKVHPDGKRLFVCAGDANYSKFTSIQTRKKECRLLIIDIDSRTKISDIDLSDLVPGKHFPNDITFDEKGNVYMTDSYANVIYKITSDGTTSVFSKHKLFVTEGVGLNGIVYHPSGFLLVDNSNTGRIYKINVNNPIDVQKVSIEQYFLGADGLILNDPYKLTVVVNGGSDKIFQLTSNDEWKTAKLTATTLIADRFTYPATATMKDKEIWVMNAKTSELVDSTAIPAKKFAIQQVVFKPVPQN